MKDTTFTVDLCKITHNHWFSCQMTSEKRRRNSILMTRHYADLGSTSDWWCRVGNSIKPIRSTTRICVVTRHQYGISALVGCLLRPGNSQRTRLFIKVLTSQLWEVKTRRRKWHVSLSRKKKHRSTIQVCMVIFNVFVTRRWPTVQLPASISSIDLTLHVAQCVQK